LNQKLTGLPPPPLSARRSAFLLGAAITYAMLSGCATYGHRMDDWVGQRYSDFLRWTGHGKEQKNVVADAMGNSVYLVNANQGENCTLSVVVDRVGFIQNWSSQGSSCR
jgi:hypothetical protein